MNNIKEIVNANINQMKIERQQAEKEVNDKNLEAIVLYFGNDSGMEEVVRSFGVDYNALSVDETNGLLCILSDASKQWENAPCDSEGPTPEQDKQLDDILMSTACDLICYFKKEQISYAG